MALAKMLQILPLPARPPQQTQPDQRHRQVEKRRVDQAGHQRNACSVTRLNREVERILTLPDVKEKLNSVGAEDGGGSPEQFGKFVRDEIAKYAKIVKEAGVKLD